MDLVRLKIATAMDHERVEALVPLMHPELDELQYRATLLCFYGFVSGWEAWSERNVPQELRALVRERRRAHLLEADLKYFGETPPTMLYTPPFGCFTSEAAFLGAMYVLEGSTLGGQFIARHLQSVLGIEPGRGDAYFRGYGESTGSMWRQFQAVLEAVPDVDADEVIVAARTMFSAFADWIRRDPTMACETAESVGVA